MPEVVRSLGRHNLASGARIVIEKPFGSDLSTSRQLNQLLHEAFSEDQIFRIDHYLGKETVQNILVFRFANSVFERVWNREAIDHIQITVSESIGIEGRGRLYEEVGALRDIVQNHVLQMLALLTISLQAAWISLGRPWPPKSAGCCRPCQPPAANCSYAFAMVSV